MDNYKPFLDWSGVVDRAGQTLQYVGYGLYPDQGSEPVTLPNVILFVA